jgi:hypothetical protein
MRLRHAQSHPVQQARGPKTDRTVPAGGAPEQGIVDHHRFAIKGQPDIEFDDIGTIVRRSLE